MKINDARCAYTSEMNSLWNERRELVQKLREEEALGMDGGRYDRVELTRELERVDREYKRAKDKAQDAADRQAEWEMLQHNLEASKQQGEAMAEAMSDMMKCLETARRIAEGAKVPPEDEKKLMEFSHELYMAAKNMAFLRRRAERKEYDTLWEEEDGEIREQEAAESETQMGAIAEEHTPPMEETVETTGAAQTG